MEKPAKGTILAPLATWKSYRPVLLSCIVVCRVSNIRVLNANTPRTGLSEEVAIHLNLNDGWASRGAAVRARRERVASLVAIVLVCAVECRNEESARTWMENKDEGAKRGRGWSGSPTPAVRARVQT